MKKDNYYIVEPTKKNFDIFFIITKIIKDIKR